VNISGNANIKAIYKSNGSTIVTVTGITLNKATLSLKTGDTDNLSADVTPSNATYKTVLWNSSNPNVASVDNTGKVTAKGSGTATITASTVEGTATPATCAVTVTPFVVSVSFDTNSFNLFIGDSRKLIANVSPSNSPNKQVTWSSNNTSIAKVASDGTVTAVASGTATITVTTVDGGRTASCTVNVKTLAQATVLLDLAAKLQSLTTGKINDWDDFNTAFGNFAVTPAGGVGSDADYEIITESGVKKLRVDEYAMWGVGVDANIAFQIGDKIEVKGKYLGGPGGGIQMIKGVHDGEKVVWDYSNSLMWLGLSSWQDFQQTITITENIGAIRLRTHGQDPWASPGGNGYIPGYVDSFVIEQIKVSRP